jgi:long-chain acyl-CoA synthetase
METGLSSAEIAERLKFTGAISLVHSALYAEKAIEAVKLSPGVQIAEFGSPRSDRFIDEGRKALASGEASVFDRPPPDEGKTSMIIFTSGTTSKPKGAELTLRGMAAFCEYARTRLKVKPGDRSLMVLPVHHIFGVCATYFMLSQGVALGVCPDFRRLYDTVARFRVNCICLVPALAEILAEKIAKHASSAEAAFGSPIDWVLIGGAPLSRRVYENLCSLGVQPLTAYGLTETTALYSIATVGDDPHVGSAGRACDLPGVEVKVSDDGVLLVKGPNVMKGYYRDPEGTAQVLSPDGWFRTGDYGRIDEDGYVWVTGRASRTIVLSSGKKIAPEELEERIHALPGVREVLVSGDGATRNITAEIYAVVPEDSVRRSISALNNSLPVHKRVRTIVIRTEPFPRTDSGKIRAPRPVPAEPSNGPVSVVNRKISSARQTVKKALSVPVVIMFLLAMLAVAVSVLGLVPELLRHEGVEIPASLCRIFRMVDLAGEILLGFFALFVVFKIWDKRR